MALSWNEIKIRSVEFSREWGNTSKERSEAKSFWDAFFNVFGIPRRRVATFEEPVKKLGEGYGFIDLFWKGVLLVEHKSRGKSLDKAYSQALDYFGGLKDYELPKYVLVSDFERFRLHDLDDDRQHEFTILSSDLVHILQGGGLFHFGVLTSLMHMVWVKHVLGIKFFRRTRAGLDFCLNSTINTFKAVNNA